MTTERDEVLETFDRYTRCRDDRLLDSLWLLLTKLTPEEAAIFGKSLLGTYGATPTESDAWSAFAEHARKAILCDPGEQRPFLPSEEATKALRKEIPQAVLRVIERDFGKDAATIFKLSDGAIDPRER